jgi:hypothetical protein
MADERRDVAVSYSVSNGRVDEVGEEGNPATESLARAAL